MPPSPNLRDDIAPSPHNITPLSPHALSDRARQAAHEIVQAGQADNTRRSYRSALRYWCAWSMARYGQALTLPAPAALVIQFVVDHTPRLVDGELIHELPLAIDEKLVAGGMKGALGPLKMSTITHRVAVLSKLHQLRRLKPNPCEDPAVRHLLSQARRAANQRGERPRKQSAATREPLAAMLATCDDSLAGLRDRALLLFAWSSGGRRRSEVARACVEHLREIDNGFALSVPHSKTQQEVRQSGDIEKPVCGAAAQALRGWLHASGITDGPIFRRVWKHRLGAGLSPAAVGEIVKRRAKAAGLAGQWAGHSLRAGFVTEAGRRKIPVAEVMAMTEHRQVDTLMGYYRTGELHTSEVGDLFAE